MRVLRLARVAAEAEGVRLRAYGRRVAVRLIIALIAAVFLLAAFLLVHVALWYEFRESLAWSPVLAAGVLAAGDLLIALILLAVASRSTPSIAEQNALAVRDRAWSGIVASFSVAALVLPAFRFAQRFMQSRRR